MEIDECIGQARRTLNAGLLLDRLSRAIGSSTYVGAGLLLLARWAMLPSRFVAAAILVPATFGLLHAAFRCRNHWHSRVDAAAWLDFHNHAGGRFLDAAEKRDTGGAVPIGRSFARPGLRVQPVLGHLLLPILFAGAAWTVPMPTPPGPDTETLGRQQMVEAYTQIEQLERSGTLEPEEADLLREALHQVTTHAVRSPEAFAEAVQDVQARAARAAARRAEQGAAALDAARTLASALADQVSGRGGEGATARMAPAQLLHALARALEALPSMERLPLEARSRLEDLLETMAPAGAGLTDLTAEALSHMTAEQLQALAQALQDARDGWLEAVQAVEELFDSQLRPGTLEDALAAFGGDPDRGPGAQPLFLRNQADAADTQFTPVPFQSSGRFLPVVPLARVPGAPGRAKGQEGEGREIQDDGRPSPMEVEPGEQGGMHLSPLQRRVAERYFSEENP